MKTLLLSTLAIFALPLAAEPTQCSYGDLQRSIEVIYANPGQPVPCEVLYDKPAEGGSTTPWRAQNEAGYCEEKAAYLAERLNDMGWNCHTAADDTEQPGDEEGASGMAEDNV